MNERLHIGWVDLLRVIACFLVVFSHCCDPFVAQFDNDRTAFLTGSALGSLVRPCVPLFVMISGVLLFPVNMGLGAFYKKRVGRLLSPLIFWSLALPILYYLYLNYLTTTMSPTIVATDFTWQNTLTKMYTFIFNFTYDTTPLWYLYMLVGLYFIIPVFGAWLEKAPPKDIRIFLWIWFFSLFLPYIKMLAPFLGYRGNFGNMGLWGVCDWNIYGTFYYISGFIGYLILAYYLVKYPLNWSWRKMTGILVPLFLAGYLLTYFGYILMQKYFPGNYAYLEIVWYFTGINVFMMTFPVFVFLQKFRLQPSPGLSRLAGATFGIYLCHFVFVQVAYDLIGELSVLPVFVRIAGMACIAFAISYGIVLVMNRFSLTRRLVK